MALFLPTIIMRDVLGYQLFWFGANTVVTLRRNNFLIWKVLINSGWGKVRARGRSAMAAEIECRVCDLLR